MMEVVTIEKPESSALKKRGTITAGDAALEALVLVALRRALASPTPLPLISSGRNAGLFPRSRAGQQAATYCREQGWLECSGTQRSGKNTTELYSITEAGLNWLGQNCDTRGIFEAVLERLEKCERQFDSWSEVLQHCRKSIEQLQQQATLLMTQIARSDVQRSELIKSVALSESAKQCLQRWHHSHPQEDCPLPVLFRQLKQQHPLLTPGQFHDALRHWYSQGRIALHPWPGPLHELPEPELAVLIGHSVAYYVSWRESALHGQQSD